MKLSPRISLAFDGRCEAALRYYEQHLGARVVGLFTYGGSPLAAEAPDDWGDKVMHATVALGDAVIAVADVPLGRYERPQGFSVLLQIPDRQDAERVYDALADGGVEIMSFQATFWAEGFGAVIDRFGIPWSINCEGAAEPAG
jgi:PhnB protein